ncbi:MAG: hypothetical protein WAZ34_08530 [Rhodocyclaceae bacterium]
MNSLENLVRVGQLKPEPPADDESSVSLCSPLNIEAYRWLLMEHGPQPIGGSSVQLEFWVPGNGKTEALLPPKCRWMPELSLVSKTARVVLGAYAKKFRLLD